MTLKNNNKLIIKAIYSLLLVVLLIMCISHFLSRYYNFVPNVVEVYNSDGVGLSFRELNSTNNVEMNFRIGALAEEKAMLTNREGRSEQILAFYTNADYGALAELEFVSGGYFLKDAVDAAYRYAVISNNLALDLFSTENAVGNTINVSDKQYNICGVYKQPYTFIDRISTNSMPAIYISRPITNTAQNIQIQILLLNNKDGGSAQRLVDDVSSHYISSIHGSIHDLRSSRILGEQIVYLSFCACIVFFVIIFLRFGGNVFITLYQSPKDDAKKNIFSCLFGVTLIACGLGLLYLIANKIAIPVIYLPIENIFDFTHYTDILLEFFRSVNFSKRSFDYSYAISAYLTCILLQSALLVLFFWKFGISILQIILLLKTQKQTKKTVSS